MPRLPDKTSIQPRTDYSTPVVHAPDTGAAFRGISRFGAALQEEGQAITKAEQGMDLIRADADFDTRLRERERAYDTDTDHGTYETRFGAEANQTMMDAAKGIRDPGLREKWMLDRATGKRNAALDRVMNRGTALARQEKEVEIGNILQGHQGAYAETDDPERRRQVLADMDAAIKVGESTGLLSPKLVEKFRDQFIDGAIVSDADARIYGGDAAGVLTDLGMIPGGKTRRKVAYGAPDLGSVSAKYESGGKGPAFVSTGEGDPGGPSYGVHQLSSKDSMPAFLRSPEGKPYAAKFARQVVGSPAFNKTYQEIARADPDGFGKAQFEFYARTHYQPALEAAKSAGFDTTDRGVQEAIFSIGVQHGGAQKIIGAAAGAGDDPQEQIRALYQARSAYVAGLRDLPGRTKQSVLNRYKSEERDALKLAGTKAGASEAMADDAEDDGLGLIPWGEATEIEQDSPARAQYRMVSGRQRQTLINKARVALSAKTQADVKSDIERLENGEEELRDERGETAFDKAQRLLTPNQREKLSQERDRAIMVRDSVKPIKFIHEDEIDGHIARIGEGAPDDRYGVVGKVRQKALAEWEKVSKERRSDPAKAVASHPRVQRAIEMENAAIGTVGISIGEDGDPVIDIQKMTAQQAQRAAQSTIEARLEAQEAVGIPKTFQRTLSKRQAERLLNMPNPAELSSQQQRQALMTAAKRASDAFGPEMGERVFRDALTLTFKPNADNMRQYMNRGRQAFEESAATEERFNLLAKRAFGKDITSQDMRRVEQLDRLDAIPPILPRTNQGLPAIGQPPPQTPQQRQPSESHIKLLMQQMAADPAKARAAFDAKFGDGAARRFITRMIEGEAESP